MNGCLYKFLNCKHTKYSNMFNVVFANFIISFLFLILFILLLYLIKYSALTIRDYKGGCRLFEYICYLLI